MWRVLKQSLLELTKKTSQRQNIYKSILFSLSYSKFTPDLTNKLGNCKAVTFKRWGVDNQLTLNCHKHPREQLLCEENLWIFPVYIPHTHTRALAHTHKQTHALRPVFSLRSFCCSDRMLRTLPGDSRLNEECYSHRVAPSGSQQVTNYWSLADDHAHIVYL